MVKSKLLDYFYKPIVVIEILTDKAADRLNELIGDDFIRLHLNGENSFEFVNRFKLFPDQWNYVFFHKDMESKIRKHTTLTW